jgi:putative aminopeptidase FrvX
MDSTTFDFLSNLLATPSVSGFEQTAARLVRRRLEPYADDIRTDIHGNTDFILNPSSPTRVMLAGHIDQIGFLVNHVTEKGYVHLTAVGGIDLSVLPGLKLTVHGRHGAVPGVLGRKAVHLMKADERDSNKKLELADLWLDIGAPDRAAALERIETGDPVTFALGITRLGEDLITGPALDDRVGVFVVAEALRLLAERRRREPDSVRCSVHAVATVQEEIGLRGAQTAAFSIDPVAGIAVDVGHSTDYPTADERLAGTIKLGQGPMVHIGPNINPRLSQIMSAAAERANIPVQKHAVGRATGTDANAMQLTRGGMATALIGLPCRYMHTPVEVVSLSDLESAARLLAETVAAITPETILIPD